MLGLRIPSRQVRTLKEVIKKQTHHIEVRLSRHMFLARPCGRSAPPTRPSGSCQPSSTKSCPQTRPATQRVSTPQNTLHAHRSMQELQTQLDQLVYSHPNLKSLPAAPSEAPHRIVLKGTTLSSGVHRVPQFVVSVL
jgi:hypothetical protein